MIVAREPEKIQKEGLEDQGGPSNNLGPLKGLFGGKEAAKKPMFS